MLAPTAAGLEPEFVSDGAGLPFPPSALKAPAGDLGLGDPAVDALAAQLRRQSPTADGSLPQLQQWRILARTDTEVLFARGLPPEMITVVMRHVGRRDGWHSVAVNRGAALRAARDGIRASNWELDETHPLTAADTVIRILVTEQTRSGGSLADKRLLTPDLHNGGDEVLLRVFVTPRTGVQMAASTPQTPVRIQLPTPIGERRLIDGALYRPS
ncbi:MAG: hypothetical protein WAK93_09570 [Solirubrobacteraceae bacterium]